MNPKLPTETEEQKAVRLRAEKDGVRSLQSSVQQRTSLFRRIQSPRLSIATGKANAGIPLTR